jgi:SAM-dependent methyltransferase
MSGVAVSGPLQGQQLKYVFSGVEEFYVWAAFHPETGIFREDASSRVAGSSLEMVTGLSRIVRGISDGATSRDAGAWWSRGMRLLDIGCGDGMIAAWFAETGLDVLAVDASPERIARARESFRGVVRLKFEVMDICRAVTFDQSFDALMDHDCLARLPAAERATYVTNVAAAARPGARFLLVLPAPGGKHENQRFVLNVRRLFESSFELLAARTTPLSHSEVGAEFRGVAFRFVRR